MKIYYILIIFYILFCILGTVGHHTEYQICIENCIEYKEIPKASMMLEPKGYVNAEGECKEQCQTLI